MDYKQFSARLAKGIENGFGGPIRACVMKAPFFDFLEVAIDVPDNKGKIASYCQRINIRCFYERHLSGEPLGGIMESLMRELEDIFGGHALEAKIKVIEDLHVYEKISSRLFIRMQPYGASNLKDVALRRVGDMAMVLNVLADNTPKSKTSLKIPLSILHEWGLGKDMAIDRALETSCKMFPPRLIAKELYEQGTIRIDERYDFLSSSRFKLQKSQIETYTLTNADGLDGASSIFYPMAARKIQMIFKEDYYILPASVNELTLRPASSMTVSFARGMAAVACVNPKLAEDEFLSSQLYKYISAKDSIQAI
jgi:hypothetical protein